MGMPETIISNLCSNAIKFTHVGGGITLKVADNDKGMLFSIMDNGKGCSTKIG